MRELGRTVNPLSKDLIGANPISSISISNNIKNFGLGIHAAKTLLLLKIKREDKVVGSSPIIPHK